MVFLKNKKGLLRILEASIAVLIVASVMLISFTNQQKNAEDIQDYVFSLQSQILADIVTRNDLRDYAIAFDESLTEKEDYEADPNYIALNEFTASRIPDFIGFHLRICPLEENPVPCNLDDSLFVENLDKDIFVEEVILSSNLNEYSPRKVRLFVWEK